MMTLTTTAISHATAIALPATSGLLGVARDQQVVDRDGREQQQVHDRVAEEPQHVLGEQRVDRDRWRKRLHDHLDQQEREWQRRDDHVDRDHGQRQHGVRQRLADREALRPQDRHAVGNRRSFCQNPPFSDGFDGPITASTIDSDQVMIATPARSTEKREERGRDMAPLPARSGTAAGTGTPTSHQAGRSPR